MANRKSSNVETRVNIPKESNGNLRHLEVQSSGKSLLVMASQTSKHNLKNVFTDTGKTLSTITEKNIPKIKFSARDESDDRRSPSPRLKSFPAEKIKKIDGNVLLKPSISPNKPINLSHSDHNVGHGDGLAASQQIQITPCQNPRNASKSQQNVSYFYHIENSNQSEEVLPSQKIFTPVVQSHRPCVPNFSHQAIIEEHLQKKQLTPRPIVSHLPTAYPIDVINQTNQKQNESKENHQESLKNEQNSKECLQINSEISEYDYEKQPVGGRNAAFHRQELLKQKPIFQKEILPNYIQHKEQQLPQQNQFQQQIQQPLSSISPVSNDPVIVWPNTDQHFTVPKIKEMQQVASYQQQKDHRAILHQQQMMKQMQQKAYYDHRYQRNEHSGMTSPQDLSLNQERQHQMDIHHMHMPVNNQNYLQKFIPSDKDPNLRAQLKSFEIDLVNPQLYQCQSNKHDKCQQPVANNYITLKNQNNFQNAQNYHRIKSTTQPIGVSDTSGQKVPTEKEIYQFTPEMLRDQEHLVATMQQQRIPENVMQRQFQLLLNEQKKQLAYSKELALNLNSVDKRISIVPKKITKVQMDEKPEWMSHITPTRIPYCELEKMKNYGFPRQNLNQLQQVDQSLLKHQAHQQQSRQSHLEQLQYHQQQCLHQQNQSQFQNQQNQNQFQYVEHQQNQNPLQHAQHQQNQNPFQHAQHQQNHYQFQHQQSQNQFQHVQHQQNQSQFQHQQNQNQFQHAQHQPNMIQNYQQQFIHRQIPDQEQRHHTYLAKQEQCHHPHSCTEAYHQNSYQNYQYPMMNTQKSYHHVMPHQPHSLSSTHTQNLNPHFQQQNRQFYQQMKNCTNQTSKIQSERISKTVEPSSLLQLRFYKEVIKPQKRNNGLQDPDIAKEALEALKNSETKKGLEYLANLNKKEPVIRLNGMEEPGEIPENLYQKSVLQSSQPITKHVSANGLENKRNPNNPLPPPAVKLRHSYSNQEQEYPRLKRSHLSQHYTHVAERENENVVPNLYQQHLYNHMPLHNWSLISNPENNQQQLSNKRQLLLSNGQGDIVPNFKKIEDSKSVVQLGNEHNNETLINQHKNALTEQCEIQEQKLIGGLSFLARKPNFISNVLNFGDTSENNSFVPHNIVS